MMAGTLSMIQPSKRRNPNTIKKITIGLEEKETQALRSVWGSSSLVTIHDMMAPPAMIRNRPALPAPDRYKISTNPFHPNPL
jgi:hypothetical protein